MALTLESVGVETGVPCGPNEVLLCHALDVLASVHEELREAEIYDVDRLALAPLDQEVFRLHVSMQHAPVVDGLEALELRRELARGVTIWSTMRSTVMRGKVHLLCLICSRLKSSNSITRILDPASSPYQYNLGTPT
jgi:hypothetical protein